METCLNVLKDAILMIDPFYLEEGKTEIPFFK